jgi:catechol 2,3-dioxygenase-like lactoylglutathione lyase family enzyme
VSDELVNVRYMVDDVETAVDFYTTHFGFALRSNAAPAFADVVRGNLRLLLSGPASSAGRSMPDGRTPAPGGWNRIHLIVDDIASEVERLRAAWAFAMTSSAGQVASRSCSKTPPATR